MEERLCWEFGLYDATTIASKFNVVVVAANYRVGVLGFLAHSALQSESSSGSTGNYCTQDQTAALR